ncbi:MAG: replicative DNA helicase [Bacteroidota bacterium]|nr:replicative DNA helicase [Bacteroidota bacterium]
METIAATVNPGVRPPADVEIEGFVLGAMLIEKEAVPKALELLNADSFYTPQHQAIFEAMMALFGSTEPIDIITVYEELKKRNKLEISGGLPYLNSLSSVISSAANIEFHAKLLVEKQILRNLISTSHSIASSAYNGSEDAFELLDTAERKIFEITESHLKKSFVGMDLAVKNALKYIEEIHSNSNNKFSVLTGFTEVDDILGGFQKSDLIILAARPAMGKTAFALSVARNAAVDYNMPVAIFSLEMPTLQLVIRLLCAEGKLEAHAVRTGKMHPEDGIKLSKNAHKLINAPMYIDDTPAQTILEIRAKARRLKAEKDIQLIVIDYLQLLQGGGKMESREREISHISRSLKALAKELNIPIIALSQMNRLVESRNDKQPQLSDLRESGSLEQDADVVIFLNRPEYYKQTVDENGRSLENIAEFIVAKHRNGPVGTKELYFAKEYARFENLAQQSYISDSSMMTQTPHEDVI